MTEVERCRIELDRARRDLDRRGLTENEMRNKRALVRRAEDRLDRAVEQAGRDLVRSRR